MMRRRFLLLLALGCGLLAGGCDRARVFEDNNDFKDNIWPVGQKPVFAFDITDTTQRYTVYLNVRNAPFYPFHNLFVKLSITGPDGRLVMPPRLHRMDLFHPETGEPLGKGTGDIYDHQFVALRHVRFARAGRYQAQTEQYMRQALLNGIMSVGLRVAREMPAGE